MQIILEKNLDFRQSQNLIILTFCCIMVLLGMLNSLELESYILMKLILFALIILFIGIIFTKKGLYVKNNNLYTAVFLFGFILKKNILLTEKYDKISLSIGKFSTNYNYTNNIKNLHNWEPDLNASEQCFILSLINENLNLRKKIFKLTKPEKVKIAIDFIVFNSNLKYD